MKEINYLKKKIRETGYPLEIEISVMLDRKWDVINTDSYFDSDEGKMRDIDISAWQHSPKTWEPIFAETGVIIECKKDESFSWVFFTRPLKFKLDDIDGHYLDQIQILTKNADATQIADIIAKKNQFSLCKYGKSCDCFRPILYEGNEGNIC